MNECTLKAWEDIQPLKGKIINQVLGAFTIKERATREDIEKITGLKTQTITPRIHELRYKHCILEVCGRGKTMSGRACDIYRITRNDQGYGGGIIIEPDPNQSTLRYLKG